MDNVACADGESFNMSILGDAIVADQREQLFNGGEKGPIAAVQVSTERIVELRGILFDIDPKNYRTSPLAPSVPRDPHEFFHAVAQKWLDRHPVLQRTEVRMSGTGLHAIAWFDEPVQFASDEDRRRWAGIVEVVQCALPIDTEQPHITALTRPVGSVNGKNGAEVRLVKEGNPISQQEVIGLYQQMCEAPFATVLNILAGANKLEPCPFCEKERSQLSPLNFVGRCYSCGNVKLDRLYNLVFAPRHSKEVEGDDACAK
jgi:hypothetical protein